MRLVQYKKGPKVNHSVFEVGLENDFNFLNVFLKIQFCFGFKVLQNLKKFGRIKVSTIKRLTYFN